MVSSLVSLESDFGGDHCYQMLTPFASFSVTQISTSVRQPTGTVPRCVPTPRAATHAAVALATDSTTTDGAVEVSGHCYQGSPITVCVDIVLWNWSR